MRTRTHGRHTMVSETSKTTSFWPCFFYNTFLYLLTNLFIDITSLYWQVFFRRVKETNKTTNLQAHFFYNAVLYCLTNLPIAIVYLYWQVFYFLKYFPQTNVFAWICTVYASLIIGCSIRYPKTGILCYIHTEVILRNQASAWFKKNSRVDYTRHYTSLKIFVACLRALGNVMTSPHSWRVNTLVISSWQVLVHELVTWMHSIRATRAINWSVYSVCSYACIYLITRWECCPCSQNKNNTCSGALSLFFGEEQNPGSRAYMILIV